MPLKWLSVTLIAALVLGITAVSGDWLHTAYSAPTSYEIQLAGSIPDLDMTQSETAAVHRFGKGLAAIEELAPQITFGFDLNHSTATQATVVGAGHLQIGSESYPVRFNPNQVLELANTAVGKVYFGGVELTVSTAKGDVPGAAVILFNPETKQAMVNISVGELGSEVLMGFGAPFMTREEMESLSKGQELTPPEATTEETTSYQYYDKGRGQSTTLAGSNMNQSTAVVSAHAWYNPSSDLGRERIRAWGRNDTVRGIYSGSRYMVSGVSKAELRLVSNCSTESRCASLMVTSTDPGNSGGGSQLIQSIIFDILGYRGVPTNTLEAIVNGIRASTSVSQPRAHDSTVTLNAGSFNAFSESQSSLPNHIAFSDADGGVEGEESGLSARWNYNLPRSQTNFRVTAEAKITYLIWTLNPMNGTWAPFHISSGIASVNHTVNTP